MSADPETQVGMMDLEAIRNHLRPVLRDLVRAYRKVGEGDPAGRMADGFHALRAAADEAEEDVYRRVAALQASQAEPVQRIEGIAHRGLHLWRFIEGTPDGRRVEDVYGSLAGFEPATLLIHGAPDRQQEDSG